MFGLITIVSCSESKSDKKVILSKPKISVALLDAKLIQFTDAQKTELLNLREELNFIYDMEVLYNSPEAVIKGRETLKKFSINKEELDKYLAALDALEQAYAGLKDKWRLQVKSTTAALNNGIEKRKKSVAREKRRLAVQTNAGNIKYYTTLLKREEEKLAKNIAHLKIVDNDRDYQFFRKRALQSDVSTAWYAGIKIYSKITNAEFEKLLITATVLEFENPVALNDDTDVFIFWANSRTTGRRREITKTYSANNPDFKEKKLLKLNVFVGTSVRKKDWLSVFAAFNGASK